MHNLPIAAQMGRHSLKTNDVSSRVLRRSQAINPISLKGLGLASAAMILVMVAGQGRHAQVSEIRQSVHSYHLWSVIDSHVSADNRDKSAGGQFGFSHLRGGPAEAFVAQSDYGPGSMDAPPGQPGYVPVPMGFPPQQPGYGPGSIDAPPGQSGYVPDPMGFPPQQPGYGPGSMDAPLGQPGYVPAPMGVPPQQPVSMPAPTGLPATPSGYGSGTAGGQPAHPSPNFHPTSIPQAQPDHGPATTDSLGARTESVHTVLRATNTARMRAEALNGGLRVYRTSSCMHQQSGGECLIKKDSNGYLFRFLGGEPGWQQLGKPPTLETEILIGRDGKTVDRLLYNGPPRGLSTPANLEVAPQPGNTNR
jgi:hypothetical protein